jgi:hypothetical protein
VESWEGGTVGGKVERCECVKMGKCGKVGSSGKVRRWERDTEKWKGGKVGQWVEK